MLTRDRSSTWWTRLLRKQCGARARGYLMDGRVPTCRMPAGHDAPQRHDASRGTRRVEWLTNERGRITAFSSSGRSSR